MSANAAQSTTLSLPKSPSENKTIFEFGYSNFISSGEPYFGKDFNVESIGTVGLYLDNVSEKAGERSAVKMGAFYSFGEDETYINPEEVYFDFGDHNEEMVLGRKKYNWSEADEIWNTGLWQPQFRWNRLRPQSQGLVGGFWQSKIEEKTIMTVFVSPVFVPDVGVNVNEENGKLRSRNPWFRPPPNTTGLFGTETDVYASLELPEASEVVFNPGLGIRFERQATETQRYGLSYAYKPVNQIMNSFNYQLRTSDVNGGVDLTFYPWVAYHHLATADWKYQDRRYGHLFSVTSEIPTRLYEDPDLNVQRLDESTIVSWTTSWNLSGEGDSASQLYGGYMRFWGGSATDGGDPVSEGTQFELRPRFISVGKLGYRYPVWSKVRRLYNSLEVNYDAIMNGGTVLTQFEYMVDGWIFAANLDLIGVFEQQDGFYKNSFVNTYRANDLIQLRMSYVY